MASFLNKFSFGVFDLDGTLVDSMEMYADFFGDLLEDFGINQEFSRTFYFSTAGMPLNKQFERALPEGVGARQNLIRKLVNEFFSRVEEMPMELFEGVEEVLESFRRRRMSLFVTTGTRFPRARLEELGLYYYFVRIIGSDERPKGPEHIHVFAESVGMSVPEFCTRAFLVGDGPSDMMLGQQMRLYTIGITNTVSSEVLRRAGAEETIDSLYRLLEI